MAAHANQSSDATIYQIGSSLKNPIDMPNIRRFFFQYFTKNPLEGKKGNPVKVGKLVLLSNAAVLQMYMLIRFMLPIKILMLGSIATCQNFHDTYRKNKRKLELTMRLIELYKPYVFFSGKFDDGNSEQLRLTLRKSCKEMEMFNFDPKSIDWEDYIMNTHIPGLIKYVMK
nr:fatty acyl-CoA reductase 1-like [Ziziphus jujuba var. spinosa]